MARILSYNRHQPKENLLDHITHVWQLFSDADRFTKMTIIIGILFIIIIPAIVAQKTGFFIHAGSSVYSTCIAPPPGFDQQQLDLLSQSKHINWCKTLAQNVPETQNTSQETTDQTSTTTSGTNPIYAVTTTIQQFLDSIKKLFTGQ